jgi:hypothetical protein
VEVYAFERSVGRELREAADFFAPIGEEMIFREAGRPEGEEPQPAEAPQPRRAAPSRPSSFGAGILDDPDRPNPGRARESSGIFGVNDEEDEEGL